MNHQKKIMDTALSSLHPNAFFLSWTADGGVVVVVCFKNFSFRKKKKKETFLFLITDTSLV